MMNKFKTVSKIKQKYEVFCNLSIGFNLKNTIFAAPNKIGQT